MVAGARRELEELSADLGRLAAEIRVAAARAQDGVLETAKLAEASARAQLESAAAESVGRVRAATPRSAPAAPEAGRPTGTGEDVAAQGVEGVLARLRSADQRLRDSDERTRRALRQLRAPE